MPGKVPHLTDRPLRTKESRHHKMQVPVLVMKVVPMAGWYPVPSLCHKADYLAPWSDYLLTPGIG